MVVREGKVAGASGWLFYNTSILTKRRGNQKWDQAIQPQGLRFSLSSLHSASGTGKVSPWGRGFCVSSSLNLSNSVSKVYVVISNRDIPSTSRTQPWAIAIACIVLRISWNLLTSNLERGSSFLMPHAGFSFIADLLSGTIDCIQVLLLLSFQHQNVILLLLFLQYNNFIIS